MESQPNTLQEAITYFSEYERCHRFILELRWPDGVVKCPRCGSAHVTYLEKARVWKCYTKHNSPKFSLKTGTVFQDSPRFRSALPRLLRLLLPLFLICF